MPSPTIRKSDSSPAGSALFHAFSQPVPSNAFVPMLVTVSAIVTVLRSLHDINAPYSIFVTLSGIVTDFNPLSANASLPILLIVSPISYFVKLFCL